MFRIFRKKDMDYSLYPSSDLWKLTLLDWFANIICVSVNGGVSIGRSSKGYKKNWVKSNEFNEKHRKIRISKAKKQESQ